MEKAANSGSVEEIGEKGAGEPTATDRIDSIINSLETDSPIDPKFRRQVDLPSWDELEKELAQHPFFMTEMPSPDQPLPPLLAALQQLKYSEEENTPTDLSLAHKEDGLFNFKLKKYRIAVHCFSEGIRHAMKDRENNSELLAQLHNNRGAAQFHLKNFRTALSDFEKALELKPDYEKAVKRSIDCCIELGRFEECLKFCQLAKSLKIEFNFDSAEAICRRKLKQQQANKSKERLATKEVQLNNKFLLERIKSRGIKLANENFLYDESESKVVLKEDKLIWPVMFYYPQYSQSDFIEEFPEDSSFLDHLQEMLDNERPSWDKENEYNSTTVDLYFIDASGGCVKVDLGSTLAAVMKSDRFTLPTNGTPGFFVMARDNGMCKVLLQRWEA